MYPQILERFRAGMSFSGPDFVRAWRELEGHRMRWNARVASFDAVLLPTSPILPPEALNQIMLYTIDRVKWPPAPYSVLPAGKTPVGLFGGCEVKIHHGPVFMGDTYYISRELIAVGETPRTKWIEISILIA